LGGVKVEVLIIIFEGEEGVDTLDGDSCGFLFEVGPGDVD
jgi:hypothetical protein